MFHMDPVDVWKGSDWDVAFRMAAANCHIAALTAEQERLRAAAGG